MPSLASLRALQKWKKVPPGDDHLKLRSVLGLSRKTDTGGDDGGGVITLDSLGLQNQDGIGGNHDISSEGRKPSSYLPRSKLRGPSEQRDDHRLPYTRPDPTHNLPSSSKSVSEILVFVSPRYVPVL